jgi:hypothetical protein
MVDVAVGHPGTSASVVLRFVRSEGAVDIPNNRSYLYADLYLAVTAPNGAGGPWKLSPPSSASLGSSLGSMGTWSGGYDLRPASSLPSLHLIHWEGWVTHAADGKRTVSFTFSFVGAGGTPLDHGEGSDSIVLTAIPRNRAMVGVAGAWKEAETYVGVNGEWKPALIYAGVSGEWKLGGAA